MKAEKQLAEFMDRCFYSKLYDLKGSFSRTTHIVKDKKTGKIRLLTAEETERIQGFPTGHTQFCDVEGELVEMPTNKRRFMMGNALVVDLIKKMENQLSCIVEGE
jgi:DNA (cytosine-5)-methyltransferase 1